MLALFLRLNYIESSQIAVVENGDNGDISISPSLYIGCHYKSVAIYVSKILMFLNLLKNLNLIFNSKDYKSLVIFTLA
jgi:hypothetical protein